MVMDTEVRCNLFNIRLLPVIWASTIVCSHLHLFYYEDSIDENKNVLLIDTGKD